MANNANQSKTYRIYLKSTKEWVEIPEEFSGSEEAPVEEANGMVATMLIICSGYSFPIFRRRQPAALRK